MNLMSNDRKPPKDPDKLAELLSKDIDSMDITEWLSIFEKAKARKKEQDEKYAEETLASTEDASEKSPARKRVPKQTSRVVSGEQTSAYIQDAESSGVQDKERDGQASQFGELNSPVGGKESSSTTAEDDAAFPDNGESSDEEVYSIDDDYFTVYGTEHVTQKRVDTVADGLVASITDLGRVDIEYIAKISDTDLKHVITALKGAILQNPETWEECFYKGWETRDEYLSGNLAHKLKVAVAANKRYSGYFADSVDAIKSVESFSATTDEIYVTLGTPWLPTEIVDEFILHLLGQYNRQYFRDQFGLPTKSFSYETKHDPVSSTWYIPEKNRYGMSVKANKQYGTASVNALHIIEKTLNCKPIGERGDFSAEERSAILEKQRAIVEEFQNWVWTDDARRKALTDIYSSIYCFINGRHYSGGFLPFTGMNPDITLYEHQKNAVARIIFSQNTLLCHEVGAGKTYTMIAAAMEMRRMGKSRKNLFVVPNNIVGQWKSMFENLYPGARLLIVTPSRFTTARRERVLETIRDRDFDGIIMAYSCFDLVPLSKSYYRQKLEEKVDAIEQTIKNLDTAPVNRYAKKKDKTTTEIDDIRKVIAASEPEICFDDLGINTLFLDEAHNYKNVPIDTEYKHMRGINSTGSAKCAEMYDKVKCVERRNAGRGVVFATGTPLTNSITDMYNFQRYLQEGELQFMELNTFDAWAKCFAEESTAMELDVDAGSFREVTRINKFHNLPELSALFNLVADFSGATADKGLPKFEGHTDEKVPKSRELQRYITELSKRCEKVRKHAVSPKEDNMLKITTDGRKAALDVRLAEPTSPPQIYSKWAVCAKNVYDIYEETAENRCAQLIFCDLSVPKCGFNVYDELKGRLIGYGVLEREIAYIHDFESPSKKEALFEMVRKGVIRVLIGSTFKLGLGVNVQERLVAVHHLDVPWRPADMVQREGRILREGNLCPEVRIYRYITEGSFDAYSWQLLETKQRFISRLLSGNVTERDGTDIDDMVLDYAEVKALAIGNPLIKERVVAENELSRLIMLQRQETSARLSMTKRKEEIPSKVKEYERKLDNAICDSGTYIENDKTPDTRDWLGKEILSAVSNNLFKAEELEIEAYKGFKLIAPVTKDVTKLQVAIQGKNRYYVETGYSEEGVIVRIENKLKGLGLYIRALSAEIERLNSELREITSALNTPNDRSEQIKIARAELSRIRKLLGEKDD